MPKYRQIVVDGSPVGIVGLDEAFGALKARGCTAYDADLDDVLLRAIGRDNYIPYAARHRYAAVLRRAYVAYLARNESNGKTTSSGYGEWHGIPREQVPWYPTIDVDLCDGCGICLRICRTGALAATVAGKVGVVEPFACVVGCNTCANLCRPGAILFPPRSILETYQSSDRHTRAGL